MRRLRHRLGRWLLRDEPRPEVRFVIQGQDTGDAIHKTLLRLKRERGGSLGLS